MPKHDLGELAELLRLETGVSNEEALKLLKSEDPIVRRQVQSVVDSVLSRTEFDAVLARHRSRFGRAREAV